MGTVQVRHTRLVPLIDCGTNPALLTPPPPPPPRSALLTPPPHPEEPPARPLLPPRPLLAPSSRPLHGEVPHPARSYRCVVSPSYFREYRVPRGVLRTGFLTTSSKVTHSRMITLGKRHRPEKNSIEIFGRFISAWLNISYSHCLLTWKGKTQSIEHVVNILTTKK